MKNISLCNDILKLDLYFFNFVLELNSLFERKTHQSRTKETILSNFGGFSLRLCIFVTEMIQL
jgi:hypothetical protein